jgi:predicted dienelactone hydrolase
MNVSPKKHPRLARRIFKGFAVLAMLGALGVGALLGALWLDHKRETTLPVPTGSFAVSRTTYAWSDSTQLDPLAPQPGTKRELLAWIWFPAAPRQPSPTTDDYLPAPWRTALERKMGVPLTQFLTRDLSRVRTHIIRDAEVSPQHPSYPVVLMRAGLAALTTDYTALAEDLASHGYVVVGFDAPYRSYIVVFPDGRVIARAPQNDADLLSGPEQEQLATKLVQAWSADMGFALDQLERLNTSDPSGRFLGRLDMQRVGVFGHSLGGATALQFCHDDSRCKAGSDVDGAPLGSVIAEGVTQPFLFLFGEHESEPDAETRPVMANIRSIYDRLPGDRRLLLMIPGANHYMFSDGAMLKSPLVMRVLRTLGIMRLDGRRQIAVTTHYISTFFDVYLQGAPASELQRQPEYPEIEYIQ